MVRKGVLLRLSADEHRAAKAAAAAAGQPVAVWIRMVIRAAGIIALKNAKRRARRKGKEST